MNRRARLSSFASALFTCAVLLFAQRADAQSPATASPTVQLQVAGDSAPTPAYAENVRLADRSLTGPRVEVAAGGLLVASAGVGLFFSVLGAALNEEDEIEDDDGPFAGMVVSTALLVGGAVLLGHGGHRIRAIKQARRGLAFQGASFAVRDEGAHVGARFAF